LLFPEPQAREILAKMMGSENVHTVANTAHSIHWEDPNTVANLIRAHTRT
jgi:pimeloyl-ACP methyl ester carboxylesterase